MVRVKVTRSFQITIPKIVREKAGIRVGDVVDVYLDERGRIVVERCARNRRVLRAGKRLGPREIEELIARGLAESLA